jgi:tetratricopeptide (TPR) repeat protein
MAEHRMYLPLASAVTMVAVSAFEIGKRLFHRQQGVVLGWVVSGSVAMAFTFLTDQRNHDYQSEATIWQDTVEKCPINPRAQNNLGLALVQLGRVRDAVGHYEQALRIRPDFAEAHCNLGVALENLGRAPEAIQHYEQALRIKPDLAEAHNNLGAVLARAGMLQQAIEHYEQALRI